MALIKCDECGREISDKSQFCPGCGFPTHLNSALHPAGHETEEPELEPEPEPEPRPRPELVYGPPSGWESMKISIGGIDPERNHWRKVYLYIGVFALVLAVIGGLYLYQSSVNDLPEDETELNDTATLVAPADSVAAESAAGDTATAATPLKAKPMPQLKPTVVPDEAEPAPAPEHHEPAPAPPERRAPAPAPDPNVVTIE